MRTHTHAIIHRSAEAVFDLSQDYALRRHWDTLTPSAALPVQSQAGVGSPVHCPTVYGFSLDVAYVNWQRPHVAAFRMLRGPWWLHAAAGTWRFTPLDADRCRVDFLYHLRAHPWLARWLNPLMRRVMQSQSRRRLDALKRVAERSSPFFLTGYFFYFRNIVLKENVDDLVALPSHAVLRRLVPPVQGRDGQPPLA